MIENPKGLEIPKGLSRKGRQAAQTILRVMAESPISVSSGGCRTFYSPQEWKDRGEPYGQGGVLVVVYDGGDARHWFTMDEGYTLYEKMREALSEIGVYAEPGTNWYSAIRIN